jgi:hypothetical protein
MNEPRMTHEGGALEGFANRLSVIAGIAREWEAQPGKMDLLMAYFATKPGDVLYGPGIILIRRDTFVETIVPMGWNQFKRTSEKIWHYTSNQRTEVTSCAKP